MSLDPQQGPGEQTAGGERGEEDAAGLVVWRICLFGDLSRSFASLVAMAAQALPGARAALATPRQGLRGC